MESPVPLPTPSGAGSWAPAWGCAGPWGGLTRACPADMEYFSLFGLEVGLVCFFFFFFFFDRWNEQYTLLLSIFPHCQWLTKAAQKNVAWRKAAAAWRGRRSHLGQNIAPCLHGLKGPSSWQNNSAGKALNTNFFTEDKRPLSNFVWQSHSSRGD